MRVVPIQSDLSSLTPVSPNLDPLVKDDRHGIKASLLIPGRGQPIEDAGVVISGSTIVWVGSMSSLPRRYGSVTFKSVPVLMPGLWDCHVHYIGSNSLGASWLGISTALAGARTAADVAATLDAGYTSVRELAGYGGDICPAINDGTIPGPHIYSSISILSMTAGHGDIHDLPVSAVRTAGIAGLPLALCDGPDECTKTVRLMIRRGARVIKLCATGGVGSELDDPQDRQFSDEELVAIVSEAARARRVVAAHCHGKSGIIAALNAGVKTIEHGSYLDEEVAEMMKDKGAILVATRSIIEGGLKMREFWSPEQYRKLVAIAGQHWKAYQIAVAAGVKMALGSDKAVSVKGTPMSHGTNGKELYWAVKAGMTPLQAIEAATATAPETLGPQAPKSGLLKEGYDADMIALSVNPLEDIDLISDVKNVTHVWKGGKLYKSPN